MAENAAGLPLTFLMREFFAALGFTQVQTDLAKRDQLLDLLVRGLSKVDPKTPEERETIRELAQRLSTLKNEPIEALPEVKRFVEVHYDPEDEARLTRQIIASREHVLRELDAQAQLLASRAA